MSKHLAELCILLVDEIYGHLPSRIFALLASHGRLPIPILVRQSSLPVRYVQSGLAILVQHRLVQYYISEDESATYYEACFRNAYDLIRVGRNIQDVERFHGRQVSHVLELVLFNGPLSSAADSELSQGASVALSNGISNGEHHINGDVFRGAHKIENMSLARIRTGNGPLEQLFTGRCIVRARQLDFMPNYDFTRMVEDDIFHRVFKGSVKGKDAKSAYARRVKSERSSMRRDNSVDHSKIFSQGVSLEDSTVSVTHNVAPQKRKGTLEYSTRPDKQRKLDRNHDNVASEEHHKVNFETESDVGLDKDPLIHGTIGSQRSIERVRASATANNRSDADRIQGNIGLRINRDKFDMLRRNERLVALAARYLGNIEAEVYAAMLRCVAKRIDCCYDEDATEAEQPDFDDEDETPNPSDMLMYSAELSPEIEFDEITAEIDPALKTLVALYAHDPKPPKIAVEIEQSGKEKRTMNGAHHGNDDLGDDGPDGDPSERSGLRAEIKKALGVLREPPHNFIDNAASHGQPRSRVNFTTLCTRLIQLELEQLINARFGSIAVRIVRYLHAKGKIEEKNIASALLLQQKDVRAKLGAMQEVGLVDTQELPRDNSRQPSRTIFLWFFDQERTRKLVLEDCYKALCRLFQRMRVEREKVQSVVEKAERSDVRGHEDEYLTDTEKRVLHDWEEKEEKILVQVGRVDDTVAILRDFLPPAMT